MRRILLLGFVVVVLAAAGVQTYRYFNRGPHGASSPQATVSAYLTALATGDRHRLEDIADPDYDSHDEISSRLAALGGSKLHIDTTDIGSTEADDTMSAQISGTLSGAPYTDTLWLYRIDGKWFIALGPNRSTHPKQPSH